MYMTADVEAVKEDCQWQARGQFHRAPLGPLAIVVTIYLPTKRWRDWKNFNKLSIDAISGIISQDDRQ